MKLLDFGDRQAGDVDADAAGRRAGQRARTCRPSRSPAANVDGRSDVWSTGVVLYELLAGRKPFQGDTLTAVIVKILREEPPSLDAVVPGLPPQLVAAVGARAREGSGRSARAKAEELGRELQYIRQSLLASASSPPMDVTRFASTGVLKALHDDRQKQATAGIGDKTLDRASRQQRRPAAAVRGRSRTRGSFAAGRRRAGARGGWRPGRCSAAVACTRRTA